MQRTRYLPILIASVMISLPASADATNLVIGPGHAMNGIRGIVTEAEPWGVPTHNSVDAAHHEATVKMWCGLEDSFYGSCWQMPVFSGYESPSIESAGTGYYYLESGVAIDEAQPLRIVFHGALTCQTPVFRVTLVNWHARDFIVPPLEPCTMMGWRMDDLFDNGLELPQSSTLVEGV